MLLLYIPAAHMHWDNYTCVMFLACCTRTPADLVVDNTSKGRRQQGTMTPRLHSGTCRSSFELAIVVGHWLHVLGAAGDGSNHSPIPLPGLLEIPTR